MEFDDDIRNDIDNVSVSELVEAIENEVYTGKKLTPRIKMTENYKYIAIDGNDITFTNRTWPKFLTIKNPFRFHYVFYYSDRVEDHWVSSKQELLDKMNMTVRFLNSHFIK